MSDTFFEKSTVALGMITTIVLLAIMTAIIIWG